MLFSFNYNRYDATRNKPMKTYADYEQANDVALLETEKRIKLKVELNLI